MTNTCSTLDYRLAPAGAEFGTGASPSRGYRDGFAVAFDPASGILPAPSRRAASNRPSLQARRRRTLLGLAVIAMLVMLALPWGGTGGPSLATPGAAHAGPLPAGTTYVVRQGDTLWGIAVRLAAGSDPRPLVARLESEAGGDVVHPGQPLLLP